MSAKPSKKRAADARMVPPSSPAVAAAAGPAVGADASPGDAPVSWLDSADPRKRRWGRIVLVGVWIYVAALWLLALDQTFHWGLFGPVVPPVS
jgi:hypothetical protein